MKVRIGLLTSFTALLVLGAVGFAEAAPTNDAFANAQSVTATSGTVEGTNLSATRETGEPQHAGLGFGQSVWYRFSPAVSGRVTFDTYGSSGAFLIAVYTGSSVSGLTAVASNAYASGNSSTPWARVEFDAVGGTTYSIAIDSWRDAAGTFKLNVNSGPPPHDHFANATTLSGGAGSFSGTTLWATAETGEPPHGNNGSHASVWHRWTPPSTGRVAFSSGAMTSVYTGSAVSSLTNVARDPGTPFLATAGTTYSIAVDSGTWTPGPYTLTWTRSTPPNDAFASARVLSGTSGSMQGDNWFATKEAGEPSHGGETGGASVWYRWSPAGGRHELSLADTSLSGIVAVYTGDSVAALTPVASGRGSTIVTTRSGTTYYVAVDGVGGAQGQFTLGWRGVPPPNDHFAAATELTGTSGSFEGSTVGATSEAGEPTHVVYGTPHTVWYRWTPTSSGIVEFDSAGSERRPALAIYRGASVTSLVAVAARRYPVDSTSVRFVFRAGVTYNIVVAAQYPNERAPGSYTVRWRLESPVAPAAPPHDAMSAPRLLANGVGRITDSNAGATRDAAEPGPLWGGASVWYRWNATQDGFVVFHSPWQDAGVRLTLNLWQLDGGTLREIDASSHGPVGVEARAGRSYLVRVDGTDGEFGRFALEWTRDAPPPGNDAFSAAQPLLGESGRVDALNLGATREPDEPYHFGSSWTGACCSIWYRWVAPATRTYAFEVEPGGSQPVVAVYTGDSLPALSRVAVGTFGAELAAVAGTEYRVAVAGDLVYGLRWRPSAAAPNDLFSAATALSGERGQLSGSTVGASLEPGERRHADWATSSLWFAWTAPRTGSVVFDTYGSGIDSVLAVYTGSSVDSLSLVAENDDANGGATSSVAFGATAGVTYRIALGAADELDGPFTLGWKMAGVGPGNDDFAAAQPLAGASGSTPLATHGAGKETGEPAHAGRAGGASIWFAWTAPASGPYRFDTLEADWDTQLAVYTGSSLGALTEVASNDDYAPYWGGASLVRIDAVAGTTYFVAVDGWSGATPSGTRTGTATLTWSARPINDDFAAARTLTTASGTLTIDNRNATYEPPSEPNPRGGTSVWFTWTAPVGGNATFSVSDSFFAVDVYTGDTLATLVPIALNDDYWYDRAPFIASAGTTYRIAVRNVVVRDGGLVTLAWSLGAPEHDNLSSARYIGFGGGRLGAGEHTVSTIGATRESGEPLHGGEAGGASVWYRFWAPVSGRIRFETAGSSFTPVLAAYAGDAYTNLSPVASTRAGTLEFAVTQNSLYALAVDGVGGSSGTLRLTWDRVHYPPANDDFADAQLVTGGPVAGTTVDATLEAGEDNDPGYWVETWGSVWYRWTAPADGAYVVQSGSQVPDVYTGDSLATLTRVSDGDEIRRFSARAGVEYRIGVAGEGAAFTLSVTASPAPANDDFRNATAIGGWTGSASYDTTGATVEANEPRAGDGSVWFRWTAPGEGVVSFSAYVDLYAGASVGSLRRIGSGGLESRVGTHAGQVLYIRIPALSTATGTISWRQDEAGPANDMFSAAEPLAAYGQLSTDATLATREAREPEASGPRTLWYRWTAPASGRATFTAVRSEVLEQLVVYRGASLETMAEIGRGPTVFAAVAGESYSIALSTDELFGIAGPLALEWGLAPPNDDLAGAQSITGANGTVTGRNLGAGAEPGEPAHAGNRGGASVWYRWTAPASGPAVIDTSGSDFDTVVAVYTGASFSDLRRSGDDDETAQRHQGRVVLDAVAGTTYLVAVDGFYGDLGLLRLNWRYGAHNDAFADAEELRDRDGRASGTSAGATKEVGEPAHAGEPGGASVWWRWTPEASGRVTIETTGSSFPATLAVYTGERVDGLLPVASARAGRVELLARAGVTYRIAVDGVGGATGRVVLSWHQAAAPAHDHFADAHELGEAGLIEDEWNGFATEQPGEPDHADRAGGASIWYRWTATRDATATFETSAYELDTTLAVYTGNAIGALTLVAANDDKDPADTDWGASSRVVFAAGAGTTYYIAVDTPDGSYLEFDFEWNAPPHNDPVSYAQGLPYESGTITADTTWATREGGEPGHGGASTGKSVWYRWTAAAADPITFDTAGSSFEAVAAVYIGTDPAALVPVASGTSVTFTPTAGQSYLVAVDGRNGGSGAFRLTWRAAAPRPANDDFAAAAPIATGWSGAQGWGNASGTTIGATQEPGEPDHGGAGTRTVWWSVTPQVGGNARISLTSQALSSVSVYRGASLGGLTLVARKLPRDLFYPASAYFPAAAGTRYYVAVEEIGNATGPVTVTFRLDGPPPANDNFANAQPISGASGSVTGDSTFAGPEPGEPAELEAGSVWYRWAPGAGTADVWLDQSTFSSVRLEVYTGSSLATLTPVPVERGWYWRPQATFRTDPGQTYWLAVAGDDSSSDAVGGGYLSLGWSLLTGDFFAGPAQLSGSGGTYRTSTAKAAREPGEPQHAGNPGGRSLWFSWTAPGTGTTTFDTNGSDFDTLLAVYTGSSLAGLTQVAANDDASATAMTSSVTFAATAGVTYRIAVDGYSGAFGELLLGWSLAGAVRDTTPPTVSVTAPAAGSTVKGDVRLTASAADNVAVARVDFLVNGALVGSDSNAPYELAWDSRTVPSGTTTVEARAVDTSDNTATASLSFTVDNRPPQTTVTGPPSTTSSTTASFTISADEPNTTLDCFLDGIRVSYCTPQVSFSGLAGGPHTFSAAATDAIGNTDPTPATHSWTILNDHFAARIALTSRQTGSNTTATKESGEPNHVGNRGGRSLWWTWTASASGAVVVDTAGSGFDTLLAVYTGTSLSGLTQVAANDNYGGATTSRVGFTAVAGTTYQVALDGRNGRSGSFVLNAALPAADTTPPNTTITSAPAATTTSTAASFAFTSTESGTFQCRLDGSAWAACTSPKAYSGLAAGAHTFDVRATDVAGNVDASPASHSWTISIDTTPPDTTITAGPSGTTTATSASFDFTSTETGSTFECRLDGSTWGACTSPKSYSGLGAATHTFDVRARDAAGNVDPSPASRTWTVSPPPDTTAPETTITAGPSGTVTATSATFEFTASEAGSSFDCRLDASAWSACASPATYTGLAQSTHTFEVRARDAAGNVDASPATRAWTVAAADTTPPDTTITSGPSGSITSTTATFEFVSTESGSTFECRLDAGAFAACSSPKSYSALSLGTHTFEVRATDAAGNVDATPAARTWTITSPSPTGPPNDAFAAATSLAGPSGAVTGTNTGATKEAGEPNHGGNAGGKSIWFSWVAPAAGTVTIDTIGSTFDTTLGVYTGASVSALTTLAGDDDSAGNTRSRVSITVASGSTYRIAVDGYGGAAGNVTLNWALSAAPAGTPHDAFADARALTTASGTTNATTAGATKEAGEPNHAGNAGGKSIWFVWTAPKTATVTFDTFGTTWDTLLAAYTGSAVGALTAHAANDDASGLQSRISFAATAGVTYRVAVDGYAGASGPVTVNWSQP